MIHKVRVLKVVSITNIQKKCLIFSDRKSALFLINEIVLDIQYVFEIRQMLYES